MGDGQEGEGDDAGMLMCQAPQESIAVNTNQSSNQVPKASAKSLGFIEGA